MADFLKMPYIKQQVEHDKKERGYKDANEDFYLLVGKSGETIRDVYWMFSWPSVDKPGTTSRITEEDINLILNYADLIVQTRENSQVHKFVEKIDELTGLLSRRGLRIELEKKLEQAKTKGEDLIVLFVDINDFNKINDIYGHGAGDKALKKIAEVFQRSIRGFDIASRWGGDEYVLGLYGTDIEGANKCLDRMEEILGKEPLEINGVKITLSLSVGITLSSKESPKGRTELLEIADDAMYEAKKIYKKAEHQRLPYYKLITRFYIS